MHFLALLTLSLAVAVGDKPSLVLEDLVIVAYVAVVDGRGGNHPGVGCTDDLDACDLFKTAVHFLFLGRLPVVLLLGLLRLPRVPENGDKPVKTP